MSQINQFNLLKRLYQNSITSKLAVIILCIDLALQCFVSTWVLFATYKFHWSLLQASLSLTLLGLMTAIAQKKVISPLIDSLGERRTIVFGLVFSIIGYLLYTLVDQGWMVYGVIIFNSFNFLTKPIAQGLLSHYVHPSEQGVIQGALASQTALAAMLGSLLATNLFAYFTSPQAPLLLPEAPFIVGILLFAVALWLNSTLLDLKFTEMAPVFMAWHHILEHTNLLCWLYLCFLISLEKIIYTSNSPVGLEEILRIKTFDINY